MWDFTITVDSPIPHNQPDITLVDKQQYNITRLIDVAIPGDSYIQQKAVEKTEKYADLWIKVQRVWQTSVSAVPIIIGALGSIPKELEVNLQERGIQKWYLLLAFLDQK